MSVEDRLPPNAPDFEGDPSAQETADADPITDWRVGRGLVWGIGLGVFCGHVALGLATGLFVGTFLDERARRRGEIAADDAS